MIKNFKRQKGCVFFSKKMSKLYTATCTCKDERVEVSFKSDATTPEGLRLSAFKALMDRYPSQRALLAVAVLQVDIKEVSLV
jgi:hypothetical protein